MKAVGSSGGGGSSSSNSKQNLARSSYYQSKDSIGLNAEIGIREVAERSQSGQ